MSRPRKQRDGVDGGAGPVEGTAKRIEGLGHTLLGREVRLSHCEFCQVDNAFLPYFEAMLATLVPDLADAEEWLGFWFTDAKGELFDKAFAPGRAAAELLLSLEQDAAIDVGGSV